MGLFDQVIGGLMGNSGNASPIQGVLMNLLSGSGQNSGGQNSGGQEGSSQGAGGLDLNALIAKFQQAGLGHVVQSWIGDGANQPVSPQQLRNVLGDDQVHEMANQAGMEPHDFLSQLSQHLPGAVDGMTSGGEVPDEGSKSV